MSAVSEPGNRTSPGSAPSPEASHGEGGHRRRQLKRQRCLPASDVISGGNSQGDLDDGEEEGEDSDYPSSKGGVAPAGGQPSAQCGMIQSSQPPLEPEGDSLLESAAPPDVKPLRNPTACPNVNLSRSKATTFIAAELMKVRHQYVGSPHDELLNWALVERTVLDATPESVVVGFAYFRPGNRFTTEGGRPTDEAIAAARRTAATIQLGDGLISALQSEKPRSARNPAR